MTGTSFKYSTQLTLQTRDSSTTETYKHFREDMDTLQATRNSLPSSEDSMPTLIRGLFSKNLPKRFSQLCLRIKIPGSGMRTMKAILHSMCCFAVDRLKRAEAELSWIRKGLRLWDQRIKNLSDLKTDLHQTLSQVQFVAKLSNQPRNPTPLLHITHLQEGKQPKTLTNHRSEALPPLQWEEQISATSTRTSIHSIQTKTKSRELWYKDPPRKLTACSTPIPWTTASTTPEGSLRMTPIHIGWTLKIYRGCRQWRTSCQGEVLSTMMMKMSW